GGPRLFQPQRTKRLRYVKRRLAGRPPGIEPPGWIDAGNRIQPDARLPSLLGRARIDRGKRNAHRAVPDPCSGIDAALHTVAGVPFHPCLALRVLSVDVEIHPFTLGRDLEL